MVYVKALLASFLALTIFVLQGCSDLWGDNKVDDDFLNFLDSIALNGNFHASSQHDMTFNYFILGGDGVRLNFKNGIYKIGGSIESFEKAFSYIGSEGFLLYFNMRKFDVISIDRIVFDDGGNKCPLVFYTKTIQYVGTDTGGWLYRKNSCISNEEIVADSRFEMVECVDELFCKVFMK